jgi:hypothetical protein
MAGEPDTAAPRPLLHYSRTPDRRRRVRWAVFALLGWVSIMAAITWGLPLARHVRRLSLQQKCLGYSPFTDMVVYSDDPAEMKELLAAGGGYTDWPPLSGRTDAVIHEPKVWQDYQPYLRGGGVAFLHRLTSPGGNARMVAIEVTPYAASHGGKRVANTVQFAAQVIVPATLRADARQIQLRSNVSPLYAWVDVRDRFRLLAGQPDAADASHFTIDYTINGSPGTIDGWLKDDDTVVLVPRGVAVGPGSFWSPNPSASPGGTLSPPATGRSSGPSLAPSDDSPIPDLSTLPAVRRNAVCVPYGKFVAFRDGPDVVAVRLRRDPRRQDGVTYEWFTAPAASGRGSNAVAKGVGDAHAPPDRGSGLVRAGPFNLEWSKCGPDSGWIYFPAGRPDLRVSGRAWDAPGRSDLTAPDVTWLGPANDLRGQ